MGEARRRGTPDQRRAEALRSMKEEFVSKLGVMDERNRSFLQAGLQPFIDRIGAAAWDERRQRILSTLRDRSLGTKLETAASIRVSEDEIGWYMFLCQQALDDPACTDVSQAQRALPFFAGLALDGSMHTW